MKIDGITLLQIIKDNKLKDNTKIDVSYLDAPINYVIAKLTYKDNELNWEPGTFRVSMLYDDYYTFEIIGETEKNKKIEKIKTNGNEFYSEYIEAWIKKSEFDAYGEYLSNKLNAVIDKLNYLLEKSDKDEN